MKLYRNRTMDGWPGLLWSLARSPSYHMIATGTAANTLLFTQWYPGRGHGKRVSWGLEEDNSHWVSCSRSCTIVYSVIKSTSTHLYCLNLFSDSISAVSWIHKLIKSFSRSDSEGPGHQIFPFCAWWEENQPGCLHFRTLCFLRKS